MRKTPKTGDFLPKIAQMTHSLPRGLQVQSWTNADGSQSVRYRVRIQRKDFKRDESFEDLAEAIQFLTLTKTKSGRDMLNGQEELKQKQIEELKVKEQEIIDKGIASFFSSRKVNEATFDYYKEHLKKVDLTKELDKRRTAPLASILKNIRSTKIIYSTNGPSIIKGLETTSEIIFGQIAITELSPYDINAYIKSRKEQGRKLSTIHREVNTISQVFELEKSTYKEYATLINPALHFNKKLLANKQLKPIYRLSKQEQENIFEALAKHPNPHILPICQLSLATAMRKSEVVLLRWSMVKDKFIELPKTKNGSPRNIVLTKEAKAILDSIERIDDQDKVFWAYKSLSGFASSFDKLMADLKYKHLSFHNFRKEAFSRFLDNIKVDNVSILAKYLGIENITSFHKTYAGEAQPNTLDTAQAIGKSGGHSKPETTNRHYFTPDLDNNN